MARILRTEPAKTLGVRMWDAVKNRDEEELRRIFGEVNDAIAELADTEGSKAFESPAHLDLGCVLIDTRNALKGVFWD